MKGERFADIVLMGGGILSALALGYVIVAYDVIRVRDFSGPVGLLVYHGGPTALSILLFSALNLPAHQKVNLSLVLVSTGATLYAVELFLPPHIPSTEGRAGHTRRTADLRSMHEVIVALRAKGFAAYPSLPIPTILAAREHGRGRLKWDLRFDGTEVLPLSGIANVVTVLCNESGEWVTYESDEHGFHNPKGLWNRTPVQIAAISDSYAQGYCVSSDKNFVAGIRSRYPGTLNLGIGGNGPLLAFATVREYLPSVRPQAVLWFFYEGNDLCEMRKEYGSSLVTRYLVSGFDQGLLARQAAIDHTLAAYLDASIDAQGAMHSLGKVLEFLTVRRLRERVGLVYGAAELPGWYLKPYGCVYVRESDGFYVEEFRKADEDLLRTILSTARTIVGNWGGRLYFVYLPEWQRYHNPSIANRDRERVLAVARAADVPIIDIHPAFASQSNPLALFPFGRQGHYNADGHRVVAEAVLRSISFGLSIGVQGSAHRGQGAEGARQGRLDARIDPKSSSEGYLGRRAGAQGEIDRM